MKIEFLLNRVFVFTSKLSFFLDEITFTSSIDSLENKKSSKVLHLFLKLKIEDLFITA
jgi:hypothetical protein